jgi:hypothetical protein
MEGEKIFGSCKWKPNLPPKSKWDSHKHNHVNFSRPSVHTNIGKSHLQIERLYEVVCIIDGGVEVLEVLCEDGVWHIE